MVVDTILPHAESGPNDHQKDAPPFSLKEYQSEKGHLVIKNHKLTKGGSLSYWKTPNWEIFQNFIS